LVWKPPVEDVKESQRPGKSHVSTEVIDLEVEELQVLNTNSFTKPVPSPPPMTSDVPTAPAHAEAALGQTSAETADASASSAEPKRHESLSDRSRGRNLVSKAVEAEKSQSQDSNELQVLNSSCTSDGLDIYGDLCLDLPRTSSQGLADTPPRRRARNLVWKAEHPTRPKSTKNEPSAVVDETAGMVDTPPLQTQQQEAALQKVLADEAAPDVEDVPGSFVSEEVEDSDDDGSVHLGEVLASQTAARAPPGAPANAVPGASHRGAPAPTVPCAKRQHDCFMLLAGVPSWLTDAELRKHASQFGQVRNLRTLSDSKGKSMGILLLEYSDVQGVRKATEADGICRIRLLQGFGIVPRVMLVSPELHQMLCKAPAEDAPWPDGGSCAEELRQKLMDVCGVQPVGSKKRTKAEDAASLTEEIKKLKGVPLAKIPVDVESKQHKAGEDWFKKLKGLKGSVHPSADGEDWAKKLKMMKGAVHPSPREESQPSVTPGIPQASPLEAPASSATATGDWAQKLKKLKGSVNSHSRS